MISLEDFDYNLPEELIAQTPLTNREECRLLCLNKETGETNHKHFYDIFDMLNKGDVLVMNDSKVIPARLFGLKEETNAHIELLMLKDLGSDIWQTLVKPARRVKVGTRVVFGDGLLSAVCVEEREEGIRHFKMCYEGIFLEVLDKLGETPLPPYIHEHLDDPNMYQTVYAKNPGSAAAPTAGLHFTKDLLKRLEEKGVELVYVTLHVGLGTFRPVNEEDITKHKMHSEYYEISQESADKLNKALTEKRRIISVGTTSTRVLESAYNNGYKECFGYTDIFIYPGYKWKAVNALITNFHLPKSTLVMLVSSLASREYILNAYKEAVENKYRFFSFGDAMFIY